MAASLILLYLISWTVFCFAPGTETVVYRAVGLIALGIAIWQWRDIRKLALSYGARQALIGYGFLLVWSLAGLAVIRNYSGAQWSGDWIEHFQRTLFFLHHFPVQSNIVGGYLLPARPPMMNLLGAFFLGQIDDRFEIYQIAFTFLNLLTFLPCCLLMRALVKNRRARYLPLVALFALNPMMMENAWYPWTKLLAVFFVLTALALYLAGLRKGDGVRIISAFICLAAGLLVHYSAGPYVLFVAAHYLVRVLSSRPNRLRELAVIGVASGLLLATWFVWALHIYGARGTFASNTSVTAAQKYQGGAGARIGYNMLATLVPPIVHNPDALDVFDQPNKLGQLRDNIFIIYQANLIFAMGLFGGPFAIFLLCRALRGRQPGNVERGFWLAFIPTMFVIGIAVVGESDPLGSAHVTLAPLIALGITLLAACFPWSRTATVFLLAGCVVDFSLGIFLQAHVEHLENTPGRIIFESGVTIRPSRGAADVPTSDSLNGAAWTNWFWKHRASLQTQWLQQLAAIPQTPEVQAMAKSIKNSSDQNARDFGGWYERHNGEIRLLGDDFSSLSFNSFDLPSLVLLFLFCELMFRFGKESMRFATSHARPLPDAKKSAVGRRR